MPGSSSRTTRSTGVSAISSRDAATGPEGTPASATPSSGAASSATADPRTYLAILGVTLRAVTRLISGRKASFGAGLSRRGSGPSPFVINVVPAVVFRTTSATTIGYCPAIDLVCANGPITGPAS